MVTSFMMLVFFGNPLNLCCFFVVFMVFVIVLKAYRLVYKASCTMELVMLDYQACGCAVKQHNARLSKQAK
jgi:hypothetical protein